MTEHVHRWLIESPHGPTSEGVCECGATRTFHNDPDRARNGETKRHEAMNKLSVGKGARWRGDGCTLRFDGSPK